MEAAATTHSAEPSEPPIVAVEPGRADASVVLGAVDAALRSGIPGLIVRVALPEGDPRHAVLAAACAADHRVRLVAPGEAVERSAWIELPARARPQPHTLGRVLAVLGDEGLARVEVPVPGRVGTLGGGGRLMARAPGTGVRRVPAGEVGLRSVASRGEPGPPPKGTLAEERAEHLRHRARASTMRARMNRNLHRLSRERLQTRHERARRGLAERRLGTSSAGEWIRWRSRAVVRRVAALPAAAAAAGRSVRNYTRRARRFAVDRVRSRRLSDS